MTHDNFTQLKGLWTLLGTANGTAGVSADQGRLYLEHMVTTPRTPPVGTVIAEDKTDAAVRGYAPFSRFTCTATDVPKI